MRTYIYQRLLLAAPTLIGVTLIIFIAMRILPCDPLLAIYGESSVLHILTEEELAARAQNALLPVVTISGIQLAFLLGGSVAVERAFAVPGLGTTLVNGIAERDWMIIQNVVLLYGEKGRKSVECAARARPESVAQFTFGGRGNHDSEAITNRAGRAGSDRPRVQFRRGS